MNNFKFNESDLEGHLVAEPEGEAVDWGEVRRRVNLSMDNFGLHGVAEHYWAAVGAYEDATGHRPGNLAKFNINQIVHEAITSRF